MATDEDRFTAFVEARGPALRRTAYLLTGDWHEAQDLAQSALVKLYLAWSRVESDGAEAYARRVLARTFVDSRRRFWRRERPTEHLPDVAELDAPTDARLDMWRALGSLTPIQRSVLVLRFWEDQSVEQVAAVLGLPPGTVKSQTRRALAQLRASLGVNSAATGSDLP